MTNQSYRVSQSCPAHAMQGLFWSLDAIRFRPETRGFSDLRQLGEKPGLPSARRVGIVCSHRVGIPFGDIYTTSDQGSTWSWLETKVSELR